MKRLSRRTSPALGHRPTEQTVQDGQYSGTSAPLLVVDGLTTEFSTPDGPVAALRNAGLVLPRGRTLGLVGESGSGKSVLVRSVMRLLRSRGVRHEGSVRFDGEELLTASNAQMRKIWGNRIAMVFQDPMTTLHPNHRIGFQITEALREHLPLSPEEARDRALRLLESVAIPEPARRLRQYPHELSGGMRQRIVIAIAIACDPDLLLADEPTTALDVTVQAQVLDLLSLHRSRRGMAMILVSHDLAVVSSRTDELAVMYSGQIVESGPTAAVLDAPLMPYTAALLRSTPTVDKAPGSRLHTIPGEPLPPERQVTGCRFASRCRYAVERCLTTEPPLATTAGGRGYRCHLPLNGTAAQEALAANLARGRTAANLAVTETDVTRGA
ncbi:ABC transporter ATP-binding protein [Actinomadura sp. 7K534]|uniref:ABC transporter ATP-binding protein n=1 Tax=Actinomadura sp. 7K534 TaxID=2530366 RepID=UPI001046BFAF|nr:ABC transporter ATP-binding protein [Actinomadura sp. 7K534]TDB95173.1 ABC transporter ATP-binding protein [Actinomadura sp. 7K534]